MTEHDVAHAHLLAQGDALSTLVTATGPIDPYIQSAKFDLSDPFVALVFYINGQLISRVAAAAIFTRLISLNGGSIDPITIASLPDETLRQVGLSSAKLRAIQGLSNSILTGELDLQELSALEDDEVLRKLTRLKGVGPWSAHLFLLRTLHRPDVFPGGDMGIRTALARLNRTLRPPTPREAIVQATAWSPYRSYAAGYLWRSLTHSPARPLSEPPTPS